MEMLKNVYSREDAIEIKDYPYGFKLRTSMFIWIEKNRHGEMRVCTSTINPKNGKENTPKKSTYSDYIRLYINDEGYIKSYHYNTYNYEGWKKVEALSLFETKEELEYYKRKINNMMLIGLAYYKNVDKEKAKAMNIEELNEYIKTLEAISW